MKNDNCISDVMQNPETTRRREEERKRRKEIEKQIEEHASRLRTLFNKDFVEKETEVKYGTDKIEYVIRFEKKGERQ